MKEKPKSNMKLKPKSKSNSLKRSLSILKGGEEQLKKDEEGKEEGKSSFFSFLSKRDDSKIPEDPNATNGAETDEAVTFKSGKLLSVLSPSEAASVGTEAPPSMAWFLFRVILVIIIVLIFILNLSGHLDSVVAFIKNFYDTNIVPLLVSTGIMKTTPAVADRSSGSLPGNDSKTGTNTMDQLKNNVGTKPVTTTPPTTTSITTTTKTLMAIMAIAGYRMLEQ